MGAITRDEAAPGGKNISRNWRSGCANANSRASKPLARFRERRGKSQKRTRDYERSYHSKAVQVLAQLLPTRKPCCTDGNKPTGEGGQSFDRDSSGITTTQSVWDPSFYTQNPSGRCRSSIQHAGKAASMQYITPSSSATSETGSSHGISHHQSLVPAEQHPETPISECPAVIHVCAHDFEHE